MKTNWLLLLIILLLFPLGQLTRLPLGFPMINIYLQDLFILVLSFLLIRRKGLKELKNNHYSKLLSPFLAISLFSWLINVSFWGLKDSLVGSLYFLRYLGYLFVLLSIFEFKKAKKQQLLKGLFLSGWTASLLGLIQYFTYPDFRSWELFDWDPHLFRVVGTYFDPGFTGMICVQTLALGLILFWPKLKKLDWKFIGYWFLPIYLSLALTYSRSSYLAYLALIALWGWSKKSFKIFLIGGGVLLFLVVLLPRRSSIGTQIERKDSIYSRIENYQHSLNIAQKKPILGIGFNNYRLAQKEAGYLEDNWQSIHSGAGADNSLLFVLATTGLLGLASYFYFLRNLLKKRNLLIWVTFLPWLIHSLFNNSLFYPWLLVWGWVILGCVSDD